MSEHSRHVPIADAPRTAMQIKDMRGVSTRILYPTGGGMSRGGLFAHKCPEPFEIIAICGLSMEDSRKRFSYYT